MTTRVRLGRGAALETVRSHPRLVEAVEHVSRRLGVPEEDIRVHLSEALRATLETIGDSYVAEMGSAIQHTEVLRKRVAEFYERVLDGQERNPDPGELALSLAELHDLVRDMSDPQKWAEQKLKDPATAQEFDSSARARAHEEAAGGGAAHPTGFALERRVWALPKEQLEALRAARAAHGDLVARALAGDPAAMSALRDALRAAGNDQATIDLVAAGVAAVRDPGLEFALGGRTGVLSSSVHGEAAQRFGRLTAAQQDAVARAAAVDPDFVRAAVTSQSGFGEPRGTHQPVRPEAMDAFCKRHGIGPEARAELEAGLRDLNSAYREAEGAAFAARETPGGTSHESAARRRRAILDEEADALGLPRGGRIALELSRASATLRRIANLSHEQFLDLAYGWLRHAEERRAAGQTPGTLRKYIEALMRTHVKGLSGELAAVFQLGPDFWVLKGPDMHVTAPGTDFVVVSKRTGEIWFCDNKALRENSLGRVSSLVDNIAGNMADDVAMFGKSIEDAAFPVPEAVTSAIGNARRASAEISALVRDMPADQVRSPEVQAEITRICDRNNVRRVVTNAGGRLGELSSALGELGIDFANLDGITLPPQRPLAPGGAP